MKHPVGLCLLLTIVSTVAALPGGRYIPSSTGDNSYQETPSNLTAARSNAERLQAGLTPLPPKRLFRATPPRRQGSLASPITKTGTIHAKVPGFSDNVVLTDLMGPTGCYDTFAYTHALVSNHLQVQITYTPGVSTNLNIKLVGSDWYLGAAAPSAADTLEPGSSNFACFTPVPDTSSRTPSDLPLGLANSDPNASNSVESAIWSLTDTTTLTLQPFWTNPPGSRVTEARGIVYNFGRGNAISITRDIAAYQAQRLPSHSYSFFGLTSWFVPNS